MAVKPKIKKSETPAGVYKLAVYRKESKADHPYYWVSVSGRDKEDETIYGNFFARLSKKASETFEAYAEETSNPRICRMYAMITDHWLKAVPGKDHNQVVLFVNDLEPSEDD